MNVEEYLRNVHHRRFQHLRGSLGDAEEHPEHDRGRNQRATSEPATGDVSLQAGLEDGRKPIQYGLIAEDVAEVFPDLVVFNKDGHPETVKYHLLAPLLRHELQKQRAESAQQMEEMDVRLRRLEAAVGVTK